jgi:uncharacterized protein YecE (DUF72 family)
MSRILIGTSGYSYKDWVGPVYPPRTAPKDYLHLYARMFPIVEFNFSYYQLPNPRTLERALHQTDYEFTFTIKGHRNLTHEFDIAEVSKRVGQFKESIAPLVQSGRLGAVLLQFPFSFYYRPPQRRYLDRLCLACEDLPLAIEFRHQSWQRESVYNAFLCRDIAFVNVDEPSLPGLLKPTVMALPTISYVRFHGRNAQQWHSGNATSRYDYRYSRDELHPWVERIAQMAQVSQRVMVLFNNHWQGQAVENARMLQQMVGA